MVNKNGYSNAKKEIEQLSHPRDRRVRQLVKKEKHHRRVVLKKKKIKVADAQKVACFFWFRQQCKTLGYISNPIPSDEVLCLVQLYINRNQKEIDELMLLRSPPRGRIRQLQTMIEVETAAFGSTKGILTPSFADASDLEILTQIWDGQAETVSVVPTQHVSLGQKVIDPKKLWILEARIQNIDEVRQEAKTVLPKMFKINSKTEKKSVKHFITSVDVQQRSIEKTRKKQKKNQAVVRHALLQERRGN